MKKKALMCFSLALLLTLGLVGTAFAVSGSETWQGYRASWTRNGSGTWCEAKTTYGITAEVVKATANLRIIDVDGVTRTVGITTTENYRTSAYAKINHPCTILGRSSGHQIINNSRSWSHYT